MNSRKHLLVQIGAMVGIFFLAIVLLLSVVIYNGMVDLFLNGKNDVISRDLERIKSEISLELPRISEIFEIWARDPEYIASDFSEEENETIGRALYARDQMTFADFDEYSDKEKAYAAKCAYLQVKGWLDREKLSFNYGNVYIMDIGSERRGFIYCIGNGNDALDISGIGQTRSIDLSKHPAIRKMISGTNETAEFETFDEADGKALYIGYTPLSELSRDKVICIEYEWSVLRNTIVGNLSLMACITLLIMLAGGTGLILYLRKRAIGPVLRIQRSLREFIDDKDSKKVDEQMSAIDPDNEIGMLSRDVSHLASELDDYISKLKESGDAMKKLTDQVMEALAHTIDAKDNYTNGHSERVAIYSRMIAKRLGLSAQEQEKIYYMGLLHDIGKIGIPKDIINKTTKLNDEEFTLIQSHTIMGYEILKEIRSMPDLALGARWHHELFDGSGYPDGLSGDKIPFLVRIIAVADSYDAMTSNRSYRKYLPQEVARAELEKNIGKQFDPSAAKCMISIIDADKSYALHE